jgi:hypothetical protein
MRTRWNNLYDGKKNIKNEDYHKVNNTSKKRGRIEITKARGDEGVTWCSLP